MFEAFALPRGTDVDGLTTYVTALISGLSALARDGASRAALNAAVDPRDAGLGRHRREAVESVASRGPVARGTRSGCARQAASSLGAAR